MAHIFIGGAWPYANGSLHLGRLASLLPGDVLARYYRAKGDEVLYVSGSDCHGTPIEVLAAQEGVPPSEIADRYHQEFEDVFRRMGFSYDRYTRTDRTFHHVVVQDLFRRLLESELLYKKTVRQTYCGTDRRFLPDRYVEGTCPVCGSQARGDQCDHCSTLLDPSDLIDRTCILCGRTPEERDTEHYYLALSKLQEPLQSYVDRHAAAWKDNAVRLTRRYLEEGLPDRAVTRDLDWGVDVPVEGFEGKKIYVWIEAVSGYLSASMQWAAETGHDWRPFWSAEEGTGITAYYVHGKDNVPFHSIIWPAILTGVGGLHLPDRILSCEYMTLEGSKFSTSRNYAVWVPDLLERYHPDSIRYFLIANGPERRDTDFSWREFISSHNGELLGAYGNLVNRTLAFIVKSFGAQVPDGALAPEWKGRILELYRETGALLAEGNLKEALERIFGGVRGANKFFDERRPWVTVKEDPASCADTLYTCVQIIANLANLLEPFLPFSSAKVRGFLQLGPAAWQWAEASARTAVQGLELLFERIDPSRITEETERLKAQMK
ncbi:methionine--tRNA ligase [Gorillibacterium sp. sgz5001074]|uniref:methionine--tRNA ligase n=1 Tax=Gorillibacterium sp. sgz5001074 TaxID=3446695 RepID=UPI003F667D5C